MRKHLFVPRRTYCLNVGTEEMTYKFAGKPFGLRGEEGWSGVEQKEVN